MFYGCEGSGTDKKMGGGYVENILISAATLWNGKKFKNFKPPNHDLLFLDSGGFSFFYAKGDYPFSTEEYVALAKGLDADIVAIRDYPCEPDVSRIGGLETNKERIDATIKNAKECMEHKNINWAMVVQGYTKDEYRYCCDQIKLNDLETDVMCVGSLCVRKRTIDARSIISLVKKNFRSRKLHGFGIDLKFIKNPSIQNMLWSADTQAWKFNNRSYRNNAEFLPRCESDKLEYFQRYKRKVDLVLGPGNSNQTKLA